MQDRRNSSALATIYPSPETYQWAMCALLVNVSQSAWEHLVNALY